LLTNIVEFALIATDNSPARLVATFFDRDLMRKFASISKFACFELDEMFTNDAVRPIKLNKILIIIIIVIIIIII